MVGGVFYTSTSLSQVAAIDLGTGEHLWVSALGDKTADQQDAYRIEVSSDGFLRFLPHIARQSNLSRLTGAR